MMPVLRERSTAQWLSGIAAASFLVGAPSCSVDVDHSSHQYSCSDQGKCPSGLECVQGMCITPGQVIDAAVVFDGTPIVVPDATIPPDADPHIYVQISSSDGDAEELISTGAVNLSSTDLELVTEADLQIVGMRFASVEIDAGQAIASAYIQFEVDEPSEGATMLSIRTETSSSPALFEAVMSNISARTTSALAVEWAPPAWPTEDAAGSDQATPELRDLLQERVNEPTWASGNAVVFLITGTGVRIAESFDGEPTAAATLVILLE